MMDKKVFIYWDNSNILVSAQEAAVEREGEAVRFRVRIHFRNLLELAHARRDVEHATAVGPFRRNCGTSGTVWRTKASPCSSWNAAPCRAANRAWTRPSRP